MKEQIKEHFEKYKVWYIGAGACAVTAGITCVITRGVSSRCIGRGATVTAGREAIVAGKNIAMSNVSFISSDRQGPPSWVVRCKETGNIFTSQRSAAFEMDLNQSLISSHLNGTTDHVNGFHFERICMAA
jgi:hypothetical protein